MKDAFTCGLHKHVRDQTPKADSVIDTSQLCRSVSDDAEAIPRPQNGMAELQGCPQKIGQCRTEPFRPQPQAL